MQRPLIIGHRGASADAPENTLAAFRLAFEGGADGIEADFRLTRDGQIVCLHDPTTGRTAGVDLCVAAATLNDLAGLDIGVWKGQRWAGERIATLDEVLDCLPAGKKIYIELKSGAEIVTPLLSCLEVSPVGAEQIRLLAFDRELAADLKQRLPGYKTCLNVEYAAAQCSDGWQSVQTELLDVLARIGADGLSSQAHPVLDLAFAQALHHIGRELHVWTVDSLSEARHYSLLGADSLMSNRPDVLLQGLLN